MRESDIQAGILAELGARPDVRLWRSNCGAARDRATGRVVRFGVPGQADLSGIYRRPCPCCGTPLGQRLEIEVKTPTGRQSPAQRKFQAMIERFGGLYIIGRGPVELPE